jgi:rubrerythrin
MVNFDESRTRKNLEVAFSGESQARNKYSFYASKAKKEGFVEIAKEIEAIADNEREHAKIWFKLLHDGEIPGMEKNLQDCIYGEKYEYTDMYVKFAKEAREEGFDAIAFLFSGVAAIECSHERKFKEMLEKVASKTVFERKIKTRWVCLNCGYTHLGESAPVGCPICSHGREYFSAV